jgi:hypothetical protein
VVQQPVEDGGRNDRIAEDRTPLAVALVGSENNAASFVTGADELKEDGRAELVQRQIPHFVDDQNFGGEIDAQPPIKPAFPVSTAEIGYQIVRRHEVRCLSGLNGCLCQRHRQVSFSHSGRTQQNDVGRFMHEPQRA